jgi:hypothetical protein
VKKLLLAVVAMASFMTMAALPSMADGFPGPIIGGGNFTDGFPGPIIGGGNFTDGFPGPIIGGGNFTN